jgi:putative (di)nucleoside polyphosphate hydrolase
VYREVEEETGITPDKLELLAESERWLAYELPESMRSAKTGRGQVQKWFAFRFHGADDDIRPDALEFSNWQWMEFNALIGQIVQFRRPVYVQLAQMFDRCLSSPIETAPGSS